MKDLSSRSKEVRAIVFVNMLLLGCFTGGVYAQSQNLKGENTQKSQITDEKPANKRDATNDARTTGKEQSKQKPRKDAGNYKGAQPPQGGRIGQGPDHPY
ncbi:hypothetical protein [Nitrosovibrio tenuis]|uniref:Uncharacterized protein n=1 Tax=Nitrosovibrio tenuis TaxID=1233 RepID=A0A1H7R2S9_9PROT|nr:hypothetical protein [Nitrosovibrio tenuis]SEL54214.1 hypothetical protein SAMN05216387_11451 [Nitrosovibrio tenuis]